MKKQIAACAIQLLFSGSRAFSIEGLREKLRELLVEEADPALRRVASVSAVDLVAALLAANSRLKEVGLQVRVTGGMVSLWAGPVKGKKMAAYLSEATGESGDPVLTESLMEVLGCVHLKQPIWQAQIDRYFDCDKRAQIMRLRELGLVEAVKDDQGRHQYITTEAFRQRFGTEPR